MLFFGLFAVIALMRVAQTFSSKYSSESITDNRTLFHSGGFNNTVSALVGFVVLIFVNDWSCDIFTVWTAAAAGLSITLATLAQLMSLRHCTIALSTMFATASILLPSVVGIFLFGEHMNLWQWSGLALFVASAYFLISASSKLKTKLSLKGVFLLIGVFLFNGLAALMQKYFAVQKGDFANVTMFNFLCFGLNGLLFYIITFLSFAKAKKKPVLLPGKLILWGIVSAISIFCIGQLVTIMAKSLPSSILFTLSGVIMLVATAVVGAIKFHEKFSLKSVCGIILSIGAAVLINIV